MSLKESCSYWLDAITPIGKTVQEYWANLEAEWFDTIKPVLTFKI
jgi:hypothetical protein